MQRAHASGAEALDRRPHLDLASVDPGEDEWDRPAPIPDDEPPPDDDLVGVGANVDAAPGEAEQQERCGHQDEPRGDRVAVGERSKDEHRPADGAPDGEVLVAGQHVADRASLDASADTDFHGLGRARRLLHGRSIPFFPHGSVAACSVAASAVAATRSNARQIGKTALRSRESALSSAASVARTATVGPSIASTVAAPR